MTLDAYRTRACYQGLKGISEINFKRRAARLEDLFPTPAGKVFCAAALRRWLSFPSAASLTGCGVGVPR